MIPFEHVRALYIEKRHPNTNLPLLQPEIPADLKLVVSELNLNPKLVAKVNWHRNLDPINNSPFSDSEYNIGTSVDQRPDLTRSDLVYAVSQKKVRTFFGTKADLLYSGFTAAAIEHKSGVFDGHVFGVQGNIARFYQTLGGPFSELGLPISDQYDFTDGIRSDFQGGSLYLPHQSWLVERTAPWDKDTQKMLAVWSNSDLKKVAEPEAPAKIAAQSPQGTEGLYMTLKESADPNQERYLLILQTTGKYAGCVTYLNCWDNRHYNLIGGTASRLGFPEPKLGVRESNRTIMPFEGGNLIWTLAAGTRHSIKR